LRERDDTDLEKSRSREMGASKKLVLNAGEFSNPILILKERLKKIQVNNKEKK